MVSGGAWRDAGIGEGEWEPRDEMSERGRLGLGFIRGAMQSFPGLFLFVSTAAAAVVRGGRGIYETATFARSCHALVSDELQSWLCGNGCM